MSGIKIPIQDVMTRLQEITVLNNDGTDMSLRARIWNNQIDHDKAGNEYSFQKPAAFVEVINGAAWQTMGQGYQFAELGFRIHLVHEMLDAGDGTMEHDLLIFDLRDAVITKLSLFEPTACTPLVKMSEQQDYDHTNIYHYLIDFGCGFIDTKGSLWDQEKLIDKDPPTNAEVDVSINDGAAQPYNIP